MKKMISLVLAGMLLLSAAGCGGSGGRAQSNATMWVSYEEVSDKIKNEENKNIFIYSYQQPILSSQSDVAKIVNNKLDNATTAFLYGSGGVQELTEMAKMDWKETWFTCYALERTVSTARIDSAVASFRYTDYAFTGGVHGYTSEYGMNYNMSTGEQMSLASLTDDEWALTEFCRQYITAICDDEEYVHKDALFPNYQDSLSTVLKNWCLTDVGLEFIAQPYVIAEYAAGTLRFTIPYEELKDVVQEQWLPVRTDGGSGEVYLSGQSGSTKFAVESDGQEITLQVRGNVYDFSVEGLNSYKSDGTNKFYVTQQHLYSPVLPDGTVFTVRLKPEAVATSIIRYRTGNGVEHQYFVEDRNGTVALTAVETLIATDD